MRYLRYALLVLLALAAMLGGPVPLVHAATFTIDSTGDGGDFSTVDGVCDTNDSTGDGPCTLRAAIEQANTSGGTDTIAFNIPGAGPHTISPGSVLPAVTDPVIIDGTTEPDFSGSPVIELDGTNLGVGCCPVGLDISAGNSTIRGLVINRFPGDGIRLNAGGNTIEGNYIGTDVTGTLDRGNGTSGQGNGVVTFGAANNTIGGTAPGAGNVISGNEEAGVVMAYASSTGNVIQGNLIGTDVSGTADLGNGKSGVTGWTIVGPPSGNTIGGRTAGAANTIAFNGWDGVRVIGTDTAIEANSIHSNELLGIDLGLGGYVGVTPNDVGDGDGPGFNGLQNFPVLTSAVGGTIEIEGSLNSTANT